ncbi:MAG: hypothetical protein K6G74_04015 [Bacilli bacterium]|nr:hypothetical protein [Bacilli bacterium]
MKEETLTLYDYLSTAKVAAKRRVIKAIRHGLAKVDGKTIDDPNFIVHPSSKIEFEGKEVPYVYHFVIMLNKPKGYMSSSIDEKYPSIFRLIPEELRDRAILSGRLDQDTEGLILFSDIGRLTNRLVLPEYGVKKEYELTLDKPISDEDFNDIINVGTDFDGEMIKPESLEYRGSKEELRIVLSQGKYHEIKRIFYRRGYKVIALRRTKFAFLELGDLEVGECRFLDTLEEEKLFKLVGMEREQKVLTVSRKTTKIV